MEMEVRRREKVEGNRKERKIGRTDLKKEI